MLNQQIITPFLFSFLLISCVDNSQGKAFRPIVSDTPTTRFERHMAEAFSDFTKKLNLPPITNGVDSFEYRFWLHVNANIINLIRIRHDHNSWTMTETIIWSHIPENNYSPFDTTNQLLETLVDSTKTRKIKPNISVASFIDSLQFYNLEQAPLNSEIEGSFALSTDAITQTFELADKLGYRRITYTCPGSIVSLENFHNSVYKLLKFLKRSLNIKFKLCWETRRTTSVLRNRGLTEGNSATDRYSASVMGRQ